ncbi:MAG: hypothetical protein KJ718_00735 [Nanoarchaeota archaeon]|nr:hypothetical protein [Nanoarchaeota archaeon]MBU1051066.1 hypothetical protein [Nanoarchaeota archaeon]MBU1987917.1 hypothetical protein [Nanoarchaeota archaeon]
MALKTFNIDAETYKTFSEHCKKEGLSMSKKVENFIREEIDKLTKPQAYQPPTPNPRPPKKSPTQNNEHPMHKYC